MMCNNQGFYIYNLTEPDDSKYVYIQSFEQGNPDAPLIPFEDLSEEAWNSFHDRRKADTYICQFNVDTIGFITICDYLDGVNLGIHLDIKFRGKGHSVELINLFLHNVAPKNTPIYTSTFEGNLAALSLIKKMGGEFFEKRKFPSRGKGLSSNVYLIFKNIKPTN